MPGSWTLVIIGLALALFGLLRLGGVNLTNFGINIGGHQQQGNYTGDIGAPKPAGEPKKTDWKALAIAVVGLLTAVFGYLRH